MMDNFVSNPLQPDAYGFLAFIAGKEMSLYMNSLKQKATKKKPFTFDRLCFVIIPIFKYLEHLKTEGNKGEMDRINAAIDSWFSIVNNQPNINMNSRFESILNIYHVLGSSTSLKSVIFMRMVTFLQQKKQLKEVMIQQVKDIHTLSKDWYLTNDERIKLYVFCAQALDVEGDPSGCFKAYF
jgi:hypothetical protein